MRDGNPSNRQNWTLVCSVCAAEFSASETIDLAGGHVATDHPDVDGIHFSLVWVGKGPAPKHMTSHPRPRHRRR